MKALLFVLLGFGAGLARASLIGIVTDEKSAAMANRVRNLMKSSECFKDFPNLEIRVKIVEAKEIGDCQVVMTRGFDCPSSGPRFAADMNADKLLVIKDSSAFAGAAPIGGVVAAMTTGAVPETGLHEFLHLFGFDDEYEYYTPSEADIYCQTKSTPNVTMFKDVPPYSSDGDARAKHSSQIPWYGTMTAKLITSGSNLGTPEAGKIGLYPSAVCNKATNGIKGWRPGDDTTPSIMASVDQNAKIPKSFCPLIARTLGEDSVSRSGSDGERSSKSGGQR